MVRYQWARSAAKHRVSRVRIRHVLETAAVAFPLFDEHGEPDPDLLLFVGDDPGGVPLEIVVRLLPDDVVRVIHAMKLRAKYRHLYDETT